MDLARANNAAMEPQMTSKTLEEQLTETKCRIITERNKRNACQRAIDTLYDHKYELEKAIAFRRPSTKGDPRHMP